MLIKLCLIFLPFIFLNNAYSLPIDWKGTLGFDTNLIKDVRHTSDNCTPTNGSQCINPEEDNARLQTMVLKLNPNLVVNDAITIRGELSTGSGRTSKLGTATTYDMNAGSAYAQTTSSTLQINKIYAELYADTALYRIGRFSKHFGLGALVNSGDKTWDRYFSGYEGIEAQLKLGNLHITPMWAKLHTSSSPNGVYDSYESSISALYDNSNKNLKVGIYYSIREVQAKTSLYDKPTGTSTGSQNINLIDIYASKVWDKYSIAIEVPMLSGSVTNLYGTGDADFDTNAFILETSYELDTKWNLGLNAGKIKGDDGTTKNFEAMYLHPNYSVSYLMFKYNYSAFMDSTGNSDVFNSPITNSTYAQFFAHYSSDEWTWKMEALWGKADQVASTGTKFYDHNNKAIVTAVADQASELGYELSLAFDYQWNPNVQVNGYVAYHVVGDFYAFDNDASNELSTTNTLGTGMSLSVNF